MNAPSINHAQSRSIALRLIKQIAIVGKGRISNYYRQNQILIVIKLTHMLDSIRHLSVPPVLFTHSSNMKTTQFTSVKFLIIAISSAIATSVVGCGGSSTNKPAIRLHLPHQRWRLLIRNRPTIWRITRKLVATASLLAPGQMFSQKKRQALLSTKIPILYSSLAMVAPQSLRLLSKACWSIR
jgi:hypothetical protein